MSKRLQVILDDKEMRDIQRIAKRRQMTVAEWVRHEFPTGDVDQMLREIEQVYQVKSPS